MEYTEYRLDSGRISLTLPVFMGGEDACRMNGFYSSAMDALWNYGHSLTENDRRMGFFCVPRTEEENGILTVTLTLTCRRTGCPSVRKTVVHRWRDGFLIRSGRIQR